MTDNHGEGIVQLEGLWLDKGGKLLRVKGSQNENDIEEDEYFQDENESIGKKHRIALSRLWHKESTDTSEGSVEDSRREAEDENPLMGRRKQVLEIITDAPGFPRQQTLAGRGKGTNLLDGVRGWEFLLGEMIEVDHVCLGVHGMCLTRDCVGGTGQPTGMGDVFFRR